jgi:uncharacterized protein with GYD domain
MTESDPSKRRKGIAGVISESAREPLKGIVKDAIKEVEAESAESEPAETEGNAAPEGGRGLLSTLFVLAVLATVAYALARQYSPAEEMAGEAADRTRETTAAATDRAEDPGVTKRAEAIAETVTATTSAVTNRVKSVADRTEHAVEERADGAVETAEEVDERVEEAGEQAEEYGEKAAEGMESAGEEDDDLTAELEDDETDEEE